MKSKARNPGKFNTVAAVVCCFALLAVTSLVRSAQGADVSPVQSKARTALLIVDVQDCFLSGGSLAVAEGEHVIPIINWIRKTYRDEFSLVAVTKDWHCDRHVSFAASHSGRQPFEDITLRYTNNGTLCLGGSITPLNFPEAVNCPPDHSGVELNQTLWPVHCVEGLGSGPASSNLDSTLQTEDSDVIITKGTSCQVDFYSAFYDLGRFSMSSLHSTLQASGIDTIFVTGLALDYCVKYTALDGKFLGYEVYVVKDATRGVSADTSDQAMVQFTQGGVRVIDSVDLHGLLVGGVSPMTASLLSPAGMIMWVGLYLGLD